MLKSFPNLGTQAWDRIEQRVRAFEDAWRGGNRPLVREFAEENPLIAAPLLVELIHADLEFRFREGESARVESYLAEFPQLNNFSEAVIGLVLTEFRLRRVREPHLELDEIIARFPKLEREIRMRWADRETAVGASAPTAGPYESAGTLPQIPGYEIDAEIGRGGMGIVYRAWDTQLKRLVAIKMIRSGAHATSEEQARFQTEAESAARLHHPHVLQVYHVGVHDGLLYLVLEYASGGSLTQSLQGSPLTAEEAARLVERLARGVATAHKSGVIHRDLKPSNILLDAERTPKIADFGLARRLDGDSLGTRTGSILGTPSYMAPEQAEAIPDRITPAVDIYALGAILYEVLTGRPPFKGATLLDTLAQVQLTEPIPPRRLVPRIPIDLETICQKCLEKDPHQRYATADDLADDLERFRRGKPVVARPVGHAIRLWRWSTRNRGIAAMTAAVLLMLVATTVGSAVFAIAMNTARKTEHNLRIVADIARANALKSETRAKDNEQRARREAEIAQRTTEFLEQLFRSADVTGFDGSGFHEQLPQSMADLTAQQIVMLGAARLQNELHDQPLIRAQLLTSVGTTAMNLGMLPQARSLLEEAVEIYRQQGEGETPASARAMVTLGRVNIDYARYLEARELIRKARPILVRAFGSDSLPVATADTYGGWAAFQHHPGDYFQEAHRLLEHATKVRIDQLGPDHPETLITRLFHLVCDYDQRWHDATVHEQLQRLLAEVDETGSGGAVKAVILFEAAGRYQRLNDSARATAHINAALEEFQRVYGSVDHPLLFLILEDAAWIAAWRGDLRSEMQHLRDSVDLGRRVFRGNPRVLERQRLLIEKCVEYGDFLEASALIDEFLQDEQSQGTTSRDHFAVQLAAVTRSIHVGNYEDAERRLHELDAIRPQWDGPFGPVGRFLFFEQSAIAACCRGQWDMVDDYLQSMAQEASHVRHDLGLRLRLRDTHLLAGSLDGAAKYQAEFERDLEMLDRQLSKVHADERPAMSVIATELGRDERYEGVLKDWETSPVSDQHPRHPFIAAVKAALAEISGRRGEWDDAASRSRAALAIREEKLGVAHPDTLDNLFQLAHICLAQGNVAEAERLGRTAVERRREVTGEDHPWTWAASCRLARLLREIGQFSEAEALARESFRHTADVLGPCHPDYATSAAELVLTLLAQQKNAAACSFLEPVVTDLCQKLPEQNPSRTLLTGLLAQCDGATAAVSCR